MASDEVDRPALARLPRFTCELDRVVTLVSARLERFKVLMTVTGLAETFELSVAVLRAKVVLTTLFDAADENETLLVAAEWALDETWLVRAKAETGASIGATVAEEVNA